MSTTAAVISTVGIGCRMNQSENAESNFTVPP